MKVNEPLTLQITLFWSRWQWFGHALQKFALFFREIGMDQKHYLFLEILGAHILDAIKPFQPAGVDPDGPVLESYQAATGIPLVGVFVQTVKAEAENE